MLKTWFKIFFRNSKKNWLNITINILGLTLGFAGLLIVLLYLKDEKSYNITNPNKNNIYRVVHQMSNNDIWSSSTNVEGSYYKNEIPEVEDFYLFNDSYSSTIVKKDSKKLFCKTLMKGSPLFFDFFPFKIIEGSANTFKKARNHVALSVAQAKKIFGDETAIGKTIDFYNRTFVVTTVYKIEGKHFLMPDIVYQFKEEPKGHWGSFSNCLLVKTNGNTNKEDLGKKAEAIWYQNFTKPSSKEEGISEAVFNEKYGLTTIFEPLLDVRLKTACSDAGPEGKGNYQLIMILLALSILLIIISCVNFVNLSIASATQRAKEVGVKKTLGLSKNNIIIQYASEVLFQGCIAFILSLIFVELILPVFNDFMKKDISILDIELLLKVGFIAFLISFTIGSINALYLAKFKSVEVLKGNISRGKQGIFARKIMLGFQFLISGFFLIGSLVIYKQVNFIMKKDLGFDGSQVIMIPINESKNRFKKYELAKKELIKNSNIEAITSNSFIIGGGGATSTNFEYKDISVQTHVNAMDYNYLDVMHIDLLKGRNIKENIASDTIKNILINESMAKALGIYNNPIGVKLKAGFSSDNNDGKNMNIIGMVKDYHVQGLDHKIPPTVFIHWNNFDWMKNNFSMIQLKINTNTAQETIDFLESYWIKNIEQGYPFEPTFVNKRFSRTYKKYEKQRTLFLILTVIVILIALLGLFALATLTIQQRLKEVAIRKTLGASVKEIMFQLIKSFLKITVISAVFLIPVAYYFIQNWLEGFVYRIDMPIIPFILTPIILIVLVFMVVGLKAYNATKINLIKYLKFE